MKFYVRVDGTERVLHVSRDGAVYRVDVDGRVLNVDARNFGDKDAFSLLIDRKSYLVEAAPVKPERGVYFARVLGRHYDVEVLDELLVAVRDAERAREHTGAFTLRAPMPGLVVQVRVTPGARVSVGEAVVVMEAMKMRNELASEVAGVVTSVAVAEGDKVDSQTPLVTIERE
ncbi:MAG TPA: biotin/lipoyl-containing protein [Candidatus Krumholzibacteria bacterium]|nr:biotin/lipoyl-containing protein [Candidatus Krumholzibacteria bacterium]